MTISTVAERARSFSEALTTQALREAITNSRSESQHLQSLEDIVQEINGTVHASSINDRDNFKKMQKIEAITEESNKNSFKFSEKDPGKEQLPNGMLPRDHGSSGDEEDVSSLSSDSKSLSDVSLEDSTESDELVVMNKKDRLPKHASTPKPSASVAKSPSFEQKEDASRVSGKIVTENESKTETIRVNIAGTSGKPNEKLSPIRGKYNGRLKRQLALDSKNTGGLTGQSNAASSSSNSTGDSSVIIPSSNNPPDLIKSNRNNSGSDDSDHKDHTRILAELQKIVREDELNGESSKAKKTDHKTVDKGETVRESQEIDGKDKSGNGEVVHEGTHEGKHDGINSRVMYTSVIEKIDEEMNKGSEEGYIQDDVKRNENSSHLQKEDTNTIINEISANADKYKHDEAKANEEEQNKREDHGEENTRKIISVTPVRLAHDSETSLYNTIQELTANSRPETSNTKGSISRPTTSTPETTNTKGSIPQPTTSTPETTNTKDSIPQPTTSTPETTNTKDSIPQPTTSTPENSESILNLERKLSDLQTSNAEQTAEVRQLKSLNESLKEQFRKLEENSSHRQGIEERMLQRNEELEKHLLGMLKSQEVIFDMQNNLKVTSADKEKLTNDYKEAIKALEAVDKLFGQKDALVKKWKEATEESRRLVELLKKHNAEVDELETVDKLKEQITDLKIKLANTEEKMTRSDAKCDDLAEQAQAWKEKYERENETAVKLNFELKEATKELNNQQKLSSKRGKKNQTLQLEITGLKDALKLAKEKLEDNEQRFKELDRKHSNTQEMYTKIIHEKEMQHSVLIKNSESYQKDLVLNIENTEQLRREAESLKENIIALKSEKNAITEKLRNHKSSLDETLKGKAELTEQLDKLQSDLEASKIEAIDNELYVEEQTVTIQELEEHCKKLQEALKKIIHSNGRSRNKRPSTAPSPYSYGGRRIRPSKTWPSQLDKYKELLSPPQGIPPPRRTPSVKRETRYRVHITNNNESEDNVGDTSEKVGEARKHLSILANRPKSTYGNRALSINHRAEFDTKDWVPKQFLADCLKRKLSSEHDSDSVTADQFAMQYVKLGDRVIFELTVDDTKQNVPATVKYIGPVYHSNFKPGIYAGLKLDIPAGDTNGRVGDRAYFRCLKHHGKFVKISHILAVQNPRTQQYTRILPTVYK